MQQPSTIKRSKSQAKETGKREDLLNTADALFAKQGFTGTGINQITRSAGVAPMTLYNNFSNKDELIRITLERRSERFLSILIDGMETAGSDPESRLLSIFDQFTFWIENEIESPDGFNGCSFIKASLEFHDRDHPARIAAQNYKNNLTRLLETNLKAGGYCNIEQLVVTFHFLIDGGIIHAYMFNDAESMRKARLAAENLLQQSR